MKGFRIILAWGLTLLMGAPAVATDIQHGIHGMQWGASISDFTDLTKVKELDQAAYYTNSNMLYETANQPVPAVFYGFYMDKFFAVFIKLRSPDQFSHLERQFSKKYGKPKTTRNTGSGRTVHRWIDADVSIKLKMRKSPLEYKMALYYLPLAAKFNQAQLENSTPDTDKPRSDTSDPSLKLTPLIEY